MDDIIKVKEDYTDRMMGKANVIGTGVGFKTKNLETTEEVVILIFVTKKLPLSELAMIDVVPKTLGGYKTDVIEIGDIVAFSTYQDKHRPAPGGVSIGHYRITAGTLGAPVYDKFTGERLILSNNHVLANSNAANVGDAILQPGPYDGGKVGADTIGTLLRFVPIQFVGETPPPPPSCNISKTYAKVGNFVAEALKSSHRIAAYQIPEKIEDNRVDAALAKPSDPAWLDDKILDIGLVPGIDIAKLGIPVFKTGRTTGHTLDQIVAIEVTVTVDYGAGRTATFGNQIMCGPMSQGGDSGSLIVSRQTGNAVGLLFAGSDIVTISSPIEYVVDKLGIKFS